MKGEIYFSFGSSENEPRIEIHDVNANSQILVLKIKEKDVIDLFRNRLVNCEFEVQNLDKIGLYHKNKTFEFPMSIEERYTENRKKNAYEIALKLCPKNYVPDSDFSSQNSFFEKDGEPWARCTIRKWSKKKPKQKKIKV